MTRTAVLLMAYGTPRTREDILPYYTDIRRGNAPTPEALADLTARYDALGGTSPLAARTEAQRDALQRALDDAAPGQFHVALGLKHADPKVEAAVDQLAAEGFTRIVDQGEAMALPQWGHAVHVQVNGLAPDRWYHYRFMLGDAAGMRRGSSRRVMYSTGGTSRPVPGCAPISPTTGSGWPWRWRYMWSAPATPRWPTSACPSCTAGRCPRVRKMCTRRPPSVTTWPPSTSMPHAPST